MDMNHFEYMMKFERRRSEITMGLMTYFWTKEQFIVNRVKQADRTNAIDAFANLLTLLLMEKT